MKYCSNCGTELLPNVNFCPSCGNKISSNFTQPNDETHTTSENPSKSRSEKINDDSSTSNFQDGSNSPSFESTNNRSDNSSSSSNGSFTENQKKLLIGSLIVFLVVIFSIIGFKSNIDSEEGPTVDSGLSNTYIDETGAVVPIDSTLAIEDAAAAAITQRNISIRNDWESYIIASRSGFKYSDLGGISDLSIIVTNKTEYVIDRVYVAVDIITVNGYKHKTEYLFFQNIKPYSRQQLEVPPTTRGTSVEYRITNVYSNSLNFKWDESDHTGNGSLDDPWKTNE